MSTSVAKAARTAVLPPASPFGKLLRRSRFASFDPQIKQVYSAPPAHAHRGDYGLKRPIPLRRKNSFITLTAPYDSREQYTEWVRGESQARFIRRFEEMDINPCVPKESTWAKHQSSKTATEWLTDSEFSSPDERPQSFEGKSAEELQADALDEILPREFDEDLTGLGGKRDIDRLEDFALGTSRLSPNFAAMTDDQFNSFVRRIRKLRPAFRKFVDTNYPHFKGKSLFELSQNELGKLHRRFLEEVTFREFNSVTSDKIEPMPHRNGGLTYHHPTDLHTHLYSKMEPGLFLQKTENRSHGGHIRSQTNPNSSHDSGNLVSFGGLRMVMADPLPILDAPKPLFDANTEEGMDSEALQESIMQVRVLPGSVLLDQIPRVVGRNAMGVKGVKIRSVATQTDAFEYQDVPHFPGTYQYSTCDGKGVLDWPLGQLHGDKSLRDLLFEDLEKKLEGGEKKDEERRTLLGAPVPFLRRSKGGTVHVDAQRQTVDMLSKLSTMAKKS